jgi:hypothetical protein
LVPLYVKSQWQIGLVYSTFNFERKFRESYCKTSLLWLQNILLDVAQEDLDASPTILKEIRIDLSSSIGLFDCQSEDQRTQY